MTGKTSIFHRASVFLKNIKTSSKAVETREASTEALVETDNIYVNTEIYSDTDLPGAYECYDGNCMILYASRSKNVATECDGCNEKAVEPDPPIATEDEKKEEPAPVVEAPMETAPDPVVQETQKDSWDEGSRLLTEAKRDHVEMKGPMCHPDCPNLFVSRCSQIDKADKVRVSSAKTVTVSISRVDKESVSSCTVDVDAARSCQRPASVPLINLSPIQEEEDPSTRISEPSIPARVSCETMQSVENAGFTVSCVTRQEDEWSVQEGDEQGGFSTDEEYTAEVAVEAEDTKEATEDALEGMDEGDATVLEDVDELAVEDAADQTISEDAADQTISEEAADQTIIEEAVDQDIDEDTADQPITDEAVDQSVLEEDVNQSDIEEAVNQSYVEEAVDNPAVDEPVDQADAEDTEDQAAIDEPVDQAGVEDTENQEAVDEPVDQAAVEDPKDEATVDEAALKAEQKADTSEKGIETETLFEREPRGRRRSRRAKAGTWISSPSPTRFEEAEIRSCIRSSRSPCSQLKYRELCETKCSSHTASCVTSTNRFCDDDSRAEQFCPTVYCSSKSSSTFGWPRDPVSCDRLYRINNAKNHSMTSCNRYHASFNKACREPNDCWSRTSQVYRNTCTPRSSMNYCSPSYYYSYNSWY